MSGSGRRGTSAPDLHFDHTIENIDATIACLMGSFTVPASPGLDYLSGRRPVGLRVNRWEGAS